ncbi:hypothetical protein C8A03DRAFT_30962 [Achaetomium macrosporum]|uniref:WSC domain-containing protein n=1 Tax=Achaetomium macrosporum TaxID=79813 RepID=A0AAN7CF72_9PEZI|nr:hypothetical protein C8A03DRAFT_30962 [Achaetomium macrosporum]
MPIQRAALLWASFGMAAAFKPAFRPMMRAAGPSIPVEYCATVNTADMDPLNSIYQSEGRCYNNCTDLNYALAIVQEKNCWCSNLIPNAADRKPLTDCQLACPGYPTDYCGGDGVYGYIAAGGGAPTGTAPPGGSATSEPDSSPSDSSSTASTTKPPPVQTVTIGGTVRTVTATADPTGAGDATLTDTEETKSIPGGTIAGIIAGVIGLLAVAAGAIWLLRRRRQDGLNEKGFGSPVGRGGSPAMMATPTTGEGSAAGGSAGLDSNNKRRSYLMPVDPRLDPFAKGIYVGDQNRSRESFSSLQDNQDYSRRVHDPPRVLRAVNPDPDDDD